jgi:hypothetical protein
MVPKFEDMPIVVIEQRQIAEVLFYAMNGTIDSITKTIVFLSR